MGSENDTTALQQSLLTEAERNLLSSSDSKTCPPLYRFVISGGPCGGKTTALARVFSYLRERGFEVINCPEAYTILNSNGMSFDFFTTPDLIIKAKEEFKKNLGDYKYKALLGDRKPALNYRD